MYQLLIVDDEEDIRRGMARGIPWNEWGFEVAGQAENGKRLCALLGKSTRMWCCPIFECRRWMGSS